MQAFGFVPTLTFWAHGTLSKDGATSYLTPTGDRESIVFLYGRMRMASKAIATRDREAFIALLDNELQRVRRDWIRNYDRGPEAWMPRHTPEGEVIKDGRT